MESPDHFLVVTEPEPGVREYDIEHSEECPREERVFLNVLDADFSEPLTYTDHTCQVGQIAESIGIEDAVADIKEIAPGRYPLRAVVEHTPSLPTNGGEEWDVWLEADA